MLSPSERDSIDESPDYPEGGKRISIEETEQEETQEHLQPQDNTADNSSLGNHQRSDSGNDVEAARTNARPWKACWMRWGPISGLLCILTALCSVGASLGILLASHNSPTSDWQFEPSAYMALFTAVANQALRMAVVQGVAIAWWSSALNGTTLKALHYEYEWLNGAPSWTAFRTGYRVTFIGLACIASAVVALDGPLLQKASTVASAPITDHPISVDITIAPEVPMNTYGNFYVTQNNHSVIDFMFDRREPSNNHRGWSPHNVLAGSLPSFGVIQKESTTDQPMHGFALGCPGTCQIKVHAPAVAQVAKILHGVAVNYHVVWPPPEANYLLQGFYPPRLAFVMYVGLLVDGPHEQINLITGYSTTSDCAGSFNYTITTLEAAIGEYDIKITNGSILAGDIGSPKILDVANNTRIGNHTVPKDSTLSGIVFQMQQEYQSGVLMETPQYQPAGLTLGSTSLPLVFQETDDQSGCVSYKDPNDWAIQQINALVFRTGVFAAQNLSTAELKDRLDPGLLVEQTVVGQLQGTQNVFHANLWWFMAAALVEITCISLILPTYYGWWHLGRPVSFSPLEIAKAFEAPILSSCNSNSRGKDIAKAVGDIKVRYGAVGVPRAKDGVDQHDAKQLAFANPADVYQPLERFKFDV